MRRTSLASSLTLALGLILTPAAHATSRPAPPLPEVDVELLLAVDVSRSMSRAELEVQRRGYAAALRSPGVIAAIEAGLTGQIALSYVEWAGAGSQTIVVDWTVISDAAGARAFAARLMDTQTPPSRRTSISGALDYARNAIQTNAYDGLRKVIDISGDGPNNEGGAVDHARNRVLAEGITINGLPLLTRERNDGAWPAVDLEAYYRACVIGGPASFVIPVHSWEGFADAVRRKLVLELVGLTPDDIAPPTAQIWRASAPPRINCGHGDPDVAYDRFNQPYPAYAAPY